MLKLVTLVVLGAALAGCSRSEPEAPAPTDTPAAQVVPRPTPARTVALPTPAAKSTPAANTSVALPPEASVGADEQMLDDASATGMTARAERDQEAVSEPAPAEPEAQ